MTKIQLGLLSFGVFLVIVAFWIAAWILTIITIGILVPLILLSIGIWIVIIGGFKAASQEETSGLSIISWGLLLVVLGSSLFMVNMGLDPLFIVISVLALIGSVAIVTALRLSKR
ncbi:MAG: hypothetical protein JSV05_00430 [Candidatus Bathyarchaeota archaeon]|nr:MAG: hypothetical protein JSV05_00430 [Candidatus Bathyarchaeota archaeon]